MRVCGIDRPNSILVTQSWVLCLCAADIRRCCVSCNDRKRLGNVPPCLTPRSRRYLIHPIQDADALAENARALIARGKPVCLHFGCGPRRIDGFLNIDKYPYLTHAADYFNFDFVERAWPIPNSCVDYIYSEDFIEHIPQKSQLAFLAESFRVLKVGAFNRVNTPCLRASMQQSDFARGFSGSLFRGVRQVEPHRLVHAGIAAGNGIHHRLQACLPDRKEPRHISPRGRRYPPRRRPERIGGKHLRRPSEMTPRRSNAYRSIPKSMDARADTRLPGHYAASSRMIV